MCSPSRRIKSARIAVSRESALRMLADGDFESVIEAAAHYDVGRSDGSRRTHHKISFSEDGTLTVSPPEA